MPCRGPDDSECRYADSIKDVADHILYLNKELDNHAGTLPAYVKEASKAPWSNLDRMDDLTAFLCDMIQNNSIHDTNAIIYNGRKKKSRALADWWESHCELDEKREAKEKQEVADEVDRKAAISRLSIRERKLLNLED